MHRRSLEHIVEAARRTPEGEGAPLCLLLGVGCSASAGVPTAEVLASWNPVVRQARLGALLDGLTVNPAHHHVARLMQSHKVDRVFTTNYDALLLRACAEQQVYPAVYSAPLRQEFLAKRALIYLHGQQLAPAPPLNRSALKALFEATSATRTWVVVGYHGLADPVFEVLAGIRHFLHGLYWVSASEPPPPVTRRLLRPQKNAFWVPDYEPDPFFEALTEGINGTAPELSPPTAPSPKDLELRLMESLLHEADALAERAQHTANQEANRLFEAAYTRYAEALVLHPQRPEIYVHWGMVLSEQAKLKLGGEAEALLGQACQKFQSAAALAPREVRIEHLWGMTLSRRAQLTRGETADRLQRDAIVHLSRAEESRPGIAAYFLACLCATRGEKAQVRLWLTRGKVAGTLPPWSALEAAPILRPYADEAWFRALAGE